MFKDITLGQFLPGDSFIHRMDATVKIVWTLLYTILLFSASNIWSFCIFFVFTAFVIFLSGIKFRYFLKSIRAIIYLLIFTSLINVFMSFNGKILFSWWIFTATDQGVWMAFQMASRLLLLITGTSLLTFTTSPIMLTDSIEKLLKPFSKIGVPAHEIAMMMTIAIRFIPTILKEADKIMKAQTARGADFKSGNLIKRAKALVPLLVPLFVSAFRRADELAVAMESKCYNGGVGRTRLNRSEISRTDYISIPFAVILTATVIASRWF